MYVPIFGVEPLNPTFIARLGLAQPLIGHSGADSGVPAVHLPRLVHHQPFVRRRWGGGKIGTIDKSPTGLPAAPFLLCGAASPNEAPPVINYDLSSNAASSARVALITGRPTPSTN
jgi:hypothetical protein